MPLTKFSSPWTMGTFSTASFNSLVCISSSSSSSFRQAPPLLFFPPNISLSLSLLPPPLLLAAHNSNLTSPSFHVLLRSPPSLRRHFSVRASNENPERSGDSSTAQLVVASSAATIALAVANRVLYKLALVPMKEYPFFLAQFTTFGYVVIYSSILHMRYRAGIVSDEMLALPKSRYAAIGAFEAVGTLIGMYAAGTLLLHRLDYFLLKSCFSLHTASLNASCCSTQTFLIWQLAFSSIFLGRRYSYAQMAGCLLVAIGVVMAVASGSSDDQMLSGDDYMWAAVMILSSALHSGAMILKEFVFLDASKKMKGKSLDIFVVNTLGSGFQVTGWQLFPKLFDLELQALFVLLLLPLMSNLKGIPLAQLPLYLKNGTGCFLNLWSDLPGKLLVESSTGAPLLPMLYIAANLTFNVSMLNLMKVSSAVVSSLATTLAVPLSIYILSLPLPYLDESSTLSPYFLFGSTTLVLGLALYNFAPKQTTT
ncbi:Protein CLT2, chloroplastic [Linum perenne]